MSEGYVSSSTQRRRKRIDLRKRIVKLKQLCGGHIDGFLCEELNAQARQVLRGLTLYEIKKLVDLAIEEWRDGRVNHEGGAG